MTLNRESVVPIFLLGTRLSVMEKNIQLENEKVAKYLGSARVQFQWLSFQKSEMNAKHVQILRFSFEHDCRRLNFRYHILVVISQQNFDFVLRFSGISSSQLTQSSQPELPELGF